MADYVAGGFAETSDGKVTLACRPEWEASNYAAQGHDPWRALRAFTGPTHILRAEKGSTCRMGDNARLRARYPHVRPQVVPGSTHFLPMERPDVVREALLDAAV